MRLTYSVDAQVIEFMKDASEWVFSLGIRGDPAQEVMSNYGTGWVWRDSVTGKMFLDLLPKSDREGESSASTIREAGLRSHIHLE
jgi:hypothetical protein